ncbi:hypothetical protein BGZ80_004641 [Entomortierella chlamydospora]|uniref:Uncharacterized protein n=1 Tax=Entomortierella chlamydospora TaxID=101097 RepID=A0A9P6SW80_9FUNG|nr:hypothetical protein BGZ80_004641 [Entomortierella chlamydospora]
MSLDYYDFLIGMDTFYRLGFSIGGIELPSNNDEACEDYEIEKEQPSLFPNTPTNEESSPEFQELKKSFLDKIKVLLDNNAKIDPKSHCPLDIMKVVLDVKNVATLKEK